LISFLQEEITIKRIPKIIMAVMKDSLVRF